MKTRNCHVVCHSSLDTYITCSFEKTTKKSGPGFRKLLTGIFILMACFFAGNAFAQQGDTTRRSLEVYGFAQLDAGYDFKQINPNWFDALRITKLPTYKNQFAPDGKTFMGVRQTRFGVRGYTPTPVGELKVVYEFDMFGVGVDEGQTTMRLRHAYGEIGKFLAGQTESPFQDRDLWPNTIEYWGPTGMVFFRNVQIRYAPVKGENEVFIALERPGASADQGNFADRIELDSVKGKNPLPDLSLHYRRSGNWGHVQLAGMFRKLEWVDIHTTGGYDISGSTTGWGAHLSTVLNLGKSLVFRGSIVRGEGIQNYMQDAPVDVGVIPTGNSAKPVEGKALPITGTMAWLDYNVNANWWISAGYSNATIDNTADASPTAYKTGQYALLTIGNSPFKNAMAAIEFQWGQREGVDGFKADEQKIMLSFKYSFSQIFNLNRKGGGQSGEQQ
jgi:hypothetical protein